MKTKGKMTFVAGLVALSLVAAACGDDDDDTATAEATAEATTEATAEAEPATTEAEPATTDAEPATTDAAPATTAAAPATTAAAAEPSGEPIKAMTLGPVDTNISPIPGIKATAEVYEQWINANGGINGRPLEMIWCDSKADPNGVAACAREAVAEDVVAVVGYAEYDMSLGVPILEEAGIPLFGGCCINGPELTSPIAYGFGSNYSLGHGSAQAMIDDGCGAIGFVYLDIVPFYADRAKAAYAALGVDPDIVTYVPIPAVPGDYGPQAALVKDSDCIYVVGSDAHWGALIPALASLGVEGYRAYGYQGTMEDLIPQYPDVLEGAVVLGTYPGLQEPMWDDFRAAIDAYSNYDGSYDGGTELGAWAAYVAFSDIVSGMDGEITSATFRETLDSLTAYETMFGAVLDFSGGPIADAPRVLNFVLTLSTIEDGVAVWTGDSVDTKELVLQGGF